MFEKYACIEWNDNGRRSVSEMTECIHDYICANLHVLICLSLWEEMKIKEFLHKYQLLTMWAPVAQCITHPITDSMDELTTPDVFYFRIIGDSCANKKICWILENYRIINVSVCANWCVRAWTPRCLYLSGSTAEISKDVTIYGVVQDNASDYGSECARIEPW